ncbi:MAG: phage shock protein PspA [Marinomonas sp.]|uniref:phage shock protein PspA n=1 Tax=Parasphingorhabdus sp. TaxID=2709688 RepID=UPI00326D3BD9
MSKPTKPTDLKKTTPDTSSLGPERTSSPTGAPTGADSSLSPESSDASAHPSSGPSSPAASRNQVRRLDQEVDRLRRSPTPTQPRANTSTNTANNYGVAFMGIFSRTRDIIAANFNDMLDSSDDPSKMIRMIILEMEETLVEVRASAARTIADQKEMHRHTVKLDRLQADWGEKAALALSKDREDLARAALVEKKKSSDMGDQLKEEIAVLDDALRAYEEDIQKLQHRLREARSRQTQIAARLESAENRVKLRSLMSTERTDEALSKFDQMERRVDFAEGRADAMGMDAAGKPSLADEIAALEGADAIDDELEAMKKALSHPDGKKGV